MKTAIPFARPIERAVREDLSAAGIASSGEVAAFLIERAGWRVIALRVAIFVAQATIWIASTLLLLRLLEPDLHRLGAFAIVGALVAFPVHQASSLIRSSITVSLATRLGCR